MLAVPAAIHQSWSTGFMRDQLAERRSIRRCNVVDDFNRTGLASPDGTPVSSATTGPYARTGGPIICPGSQWVMPSRRTTLRKVRKMILSSNANDW
jgi:hypothetical protein